MIFVSVGTQKFQMDRLMKQVDLLARMMPEEKFVVQYGNSNYVPTNCEAHQFMDRDLFTRCMEQSRLLILHGGVGTIMQGLRLSKPIIVVPRLKAFNEHVDDHQVEAAYALKSYDCLLICMNVEFLDYMIRNINTVTFNKYVEPIHKVEDIVLDTIEHEVASKKHLWSSIKSFFQKMKKSDEYNYSLSIETGDVASSVGYADNRVSSFGA